MRVIRKLAFLTIFLLLLPTFASAGERGHREILPRLDATWVWQVLTRPWILIGKAPEPDANKGRGTMDPNGAPCSESEPECSSD